MSWVAMQTDIRQTELYREIEAFYKQVRQPGSGQITEATEIHASPDGLSAVFTGTMVDTLDGIPPTRVCRIDLRTGAVQVLTFGPNADRLPKYSPDGRLVAFLSDRHKSGDFQLYLLDPDTGAARRTPPVNGWVEHLQWSADGRRILLGVAGASADVSAVHGAIARSQTDTSSPSWMPDIATADVKQRWRSAWIYDLTSDRATPIDTPGINIWEAAWCGSEAIAAVASSGPGEGFWYRANLLIIDIGSGESRELYRPKHQLGWPAASGSGARLAFVEAVSSDRWIVAGSLRLLDTASGHVTVTDTHEIDVSYVEWRSERHLLVAGLRGPETVVGTCDTDTGEFIESWKSPALSTSGSVISVSGCGASGDCVLIGEGFVRAPEIAAVRNGSYRTLKSFDVGYAACVKSIESVQYLAWAAPDGLEIQGWLIQPHGTCPFPIVMNVHGGPVASWRPTWLARPRSAAMPLLVRHGYAIFMPNPRGSSGRGVDFARRVLGDLGGADTHDLLSGLDYLIAQGIADPKRLGVTGVSYGGYMSCWLTTQDPRFAASVPVSPATNRVSQRLLCTHTDFVDLFLADAYDTLGGRFFERSPIMYAHKATTPTLNICGALDRCTPPGEARQFHNALLENGVTSVLVSYPEEGHGIRKFPTAIDYATRMISWFEEHMPAAPRR